MNIDTEDIQCYIDRLKPEARAQVEKALRTTLEYILDLRNGACYRYEKEINEAIDAVRENRLQQLRERIEDKRRH